MGNIWYWYQIFLISSSNCHTDYLFWFDVYYKSAVQKNSLSTGIFGERKFPANPQGSSVV